MDYLKLDPRILRKPEFMEVNWFCKQVYIGLLLLSAEHDLKGEFIAGYDQPHWIGTQLGMEKGEPYDLESALDHLLQTGHLVRRGSGFALAKWEEYYAPKDPTNAARQSKYRAKLLAQKVNTGTVSNGTKPNPTQQNTTQLPPTPNGGEAGSEGETFTPDDLALLWNELAYKGAPRVLTVDGRRETTALARLSERPLLPELSQKEFWTKVITSLNALPFYTGKGPRGWKADFDYIIRLGVAAKILEQASSTAETPRQTSKVEPGEDLYGGEG